MKSFTKSAIVAVAVTAAAFGFAGPAASAPVGPSSVGQTVDKLAAQGFHVVVEKVGTAALDRCVVRSIRPGQSYSRMDSGSGTPGASDDIVTTVNAMTVYVDVAC